MFILYIPQTEINISLPEFKKLMPSLDIRPSGKTRINQEREKKGSVGRCKPDCRLQTTFRPE